jgi:hypothetical protein
MNGVKINKPTLWYRLGFRYRFDEGLFNWRDEETPGFAPDAITTRIKIRVSFADRLRLLVSGHCEVSAYTKTNVPVDHAITRSRFAVLPP